MRQIVLPNTMVLIDRVDAGLGPDLLLLRSLSGDGDPLAQRVGIDRAFWRGREDWQALRSSMVPRRKLSLVPYNPASPL